MTKTTNYLSVFPVQIIKISSEIKKIVKHINNNKQCQRHFKLKIFFFRLYKQRDNVIQFSLSSIEKKKKKKIEKQIFN